jgi:hypothetical protein
LCVRQLLSYWNRSKAERRTAYEGISTPYVHVCDDEEI